MFLKLTEIKIWLAEILLTFLFISVGTEVSKFKSEIIKVCSTCVCVCFEFLNCKLHGPIKTQEMISMEATLTP